MPGPLYQTAADISRRSNTAIRGMHQRANIAAIKALTTTTYGDGRPVFDRDTKEVYVWDSTSTATPDDDAVLQPDAAPAAGRWLKETAITTYQGGLPTIGIDVATSLPTSPTVGQTIALDGHILSWDGSAWRSSGALIQSVTGVTVTQVVTDGVPHEPTSHDYVSGVAAWISGTDAVLVRKGLVDGFTGLTPGTAYFAGGSGSLTTTPTSRMTYVGRAVSTTALYVDTDSRSTGI